MLSFLKNHPFAVEAFFTRSLVLTFCAPKEQLAHLLPPCLALDTFDEKLGFVAVAMVQTKKLRPKGFPEFLGNDFFLIGYRLFIKYHSKAGKRLRGLYILKSETDKKKMEWLGNIFTRYQYTTTDIQQKLDESSLKIFSQKSGIDVKADIGNVHATLPENSPFTEWKQARRFAGPLPFTFSYIPETQKVLVIEGVREDWHPQPVQLEAYNIKFPEKLEGCDLTLASVFMVENIPYYWKKGKLELWNPQEIF
jgi:hypothetical protein